LKQHVRKIKCSVDFILQLSACCRIDTLSIPTRRAEALAGKSSSCSGQYRSTSRRDVAKHNILQ
jgi:hypothetical protein